MFAISHASLLTIIFVYPSSLTLRSVNGPTSPLPFLPPSRATTLTVSNQTLSRRRIRDMLGPTNMGEIPVIFGGIV